jgi:alkylhydroperoxidase family enzyme
MQQGLTDELYNSVNCAHGSTDFSAREKLAIDFAERFAIDHTAIDEAMWTQLHALFTDTEIVELVCTVGFCVGMGRAYQVLDIARDFDVLWSREPKNPSPE